MTKSSVAACGTGWELHIIAPVTPAQSAAAQRTPMETTRLGVEATGTELLGTMPSVTSSSTLLGRRPWHLRERLLVWSPTPTQGRQTYSSQGRRNRGGHRGQGPPCFTASKVDLQSVRRPVAPRSSRLCRSHGARRTRCHRHSYTV